MCYLVMGLNSWTSSVIQLGYVTGSQKREGDLFYNKPGQSISGPITLAVNVGIQCSCVLSGHK